MHWHRKLVHDAYVHATLVRDMLTGRNSCVTDADAHLVPTKGLLQRTRGEDPGQQGAEGFAHQVRHAQPRAAYLQDALHGHPRRQPLAPLCHRHPLWYSSGPGHAVSHPHLERRDSLSSSMPSLTAAQASASRPPKRISSQCLHMCSTSSSCSLLRGCRNASRCARCWRPSRSSGVYLYWAPCSLSPRQQDPGLATSSRCVSPTLALLDDAEYIW